MEGTTNEKKKKKKKKKRKTKGGVLQKFAKVAAAVSFSIQSSLEPSDSALSE